jgi:hypothetical protein
MRFERSIRLNQQLCLFGSINVSIGLFSSDRAAGAPARAIDSPHSPGVVSTRSGIDDLSGGGQLCRVEERRRLE